MGGAERDFGGERWGSDGEMSSVQNPGWLFYVENYTTHFYGDCNKHRDPMLSIRILFQCQPNVLNAAQMGSKRRIFLRK